MWWGGLKCTVLCPCPGQPEQQGLWPGPADCGERGGGTQHLPQRGGGSGSAHLHQWRQGTNRKPEVTFMSSNNHETVHVHLNY